MELDAVSLLAFMHLESGLYLRLRSISLQVVLRRKQDCFEMRKTMFSVGTYDFNHFLHNYNEIAIIVIILIS